MMKRKGYRKVLIEISDEFYMKLKHSKLRFAVCLEAGYNSLNAQTPILDRIRACEEKIEKLRESKDRRMYMFSERLSKLELTSSQHIV